MLVIEQDCIPLKLCLLVDGLDEYDGDHEELSESFKEVTAKQNSSVKASLSSRPWSVFRDCFEGCLKLRVQDLTFDDIELYVSDKMHRNSAFQRLSLKDHKAAQMLIRATVERAEGVFLWVWLVVKSLLNGISNRDTISDLRKRLQSIPTELEPLHRLLINQIQPIYLPWASKAFQIVRACRELSGNPLTLQGFCLAI